MKTPSFWESRNAISTMLAPFSILYDIVGTLKRAQIKPTAFPIPIVCIGNLTAGGAGKTPIALHIGKKLKERNVGAFYLSRGYGGKQDGPLLVNPKKHKARDVGDEPLLLAEVLPTVIAKDRVSGARYAITKGAKIIVMDDGFQNPSIVKSLSLLVIDGQRVFGNGLMIPAGPLREQPENGFRRAHAIVVLNRSTRVPPLPADRPVLYARSEPQFADSLKGKKVIPFCGIAYPDKFFDSVISTGAQIVEKAAFGDHYQYSKMDIQKLLFKAYIADAMLITTAKDAVRLPAELRDCIAVLDMTVEFESPAMLDILIDYILKPDETP